MQQKAVSIKFFNVKSANCELDFFSGNIIEYTLFYAQNSGK